MSMKKLAIAVGSVAAVLGSGSAGAINLPNPTFSAFLYGDFYSYSLPILADKYDLVNGGGVGPGNPYYVASTPGAIQDLVVVGTGSSGGPVNTNFTGMDNAYATPSGVNGSPLFQTTTANPGGVADPGQVAAFAGDSENSWDSTVAAMLSFLNGGNLVFFFNNNQVNSGATTNQNLMAWARVTLTGQSGSAIFDFTNNGGAGGIPGGDPTAFTATIANAPAAGAAPAAVVANDPYYVLSGGQVTLTGAGACTDLNGNLVPTCDPNTASETFNHNLGANQAAYMLYSPELQAAMESGSYSLMSIDWRMSALNNGYEQLFIGAANGPPLFCEQFPNDPRCNSVPEPGSLSLFGLGLAAAALVERSRRRRFHGTLDPRVS